MIIAILRPFFYQFGATMDAIGKPQLNFWYNLLLMAINFTLTYLGLYWIGRDGVAWALVVHHIISLLIVYGVLKRHVNIEMKNVAFYAIGNYKYMYTLAKNMLSGSPKQKPNSNGTHDLPKIKQETYL